MEQQLAESMAQAEREQKAKEEKEKANKMISVARLTNRDKKSGGKSTRRKSSGEKSENSRRSNAPKISF